MKARAKGAAFAFREAFGAVPGADVTNLGSALSQDYQCKVGCRAMLLKDFFKAVLCCGLEELTCLMRWLLSCLAHAWQ